MIRAARAVAAAIALMCGGYVALAALCGPAAADSGGAQAGLPRVPLVVLAAIPDLRWTDVAAMPTLSALERRSAVGLLADKTVNAATGCADGLLAVAAGTRTVPPPGATAGDCSAATGPASATVNAADAYAADVHALGDQLQAAGISSVAAGAGAAAVTGTDSGGPATPTAPTAVKALRRAEAGSPRPSAGTVAVVVQPALVDSGDRQAARGIVDSWLRSVVAATPANALLLVAGTSDAAAGAAHLHVLLASGPGIGHVSLGPGGGRQAPYVQLIDVAPTVAQALGLTPSTAYDGTALAPSGAAAPTVAQLVDDDRHAVEGVTAAVVVRTLVLGLVAAALALFLGAFRRPGLLGPARAVARVAAPVVVLSWLIQLLPWWREPVLWLVVGLLAAGGLAAGAAAARRRGLPAAAELIAWPAAAVLLLVADQCAGSPLQLSAPLGNQPLQAGRFAGMGNTAFAVLLASALLVAAVLATTLSDRGHRTLGLALAASLLIVVVAVDAAPSLGDDLGGAVAALPAAVVTMALLAGVRLRPTRVAVIAIAALALGMGAALLDYRRPVSQQTHLGRFVGDLLHGGGGTTLRRKLDAVWQLQGEIPLLLAVAAGFAPGAVRRNVVAWLRRTPGLPAAAGGIVVLGVVGSLTNDSGVTVAAFALVAVLPAVLAAAPPPLAASAAPQDA